MNLEHVEEELGAYPSHFKIDGINKLSFPKMRSMMSRIKEGQVERLDLRDKPWDHEVRRDDNLLLFLEYRLCETGDSSSVLEKVKKNVEDYRKDMIALTNLAWMYRDRFDTLEAGRCLKRLKELDNFSNIYAIAEIAYSLTRMGPNHLLKARDLFGRVIRFEEYPELNESESDKPPELEWHRIVWCFGLILVNHRILNPSIFGDYNLDGGPKGEPEKILEQSCELLKTIISSEGPNIYVAKAWLWLINLFMNYKDIEPHVNRTLELSDLMNGLDEKDCLQKAIEAMKTVSKEDHHTLFMIGRAFQRAPLRDLEKAEYYLRKTIKHINKPSAYHHLARVCRAKWLREKYNIDKDDVVENRRDPGNPLLEEAIENLSKAIEHSHKTGVIFFVDKARCKFSATDEPFTAESKVAILSILREALVCINRYSISTKTDRANAFLQLGLFHEEFGERAKSKNYLKLSVQMAVSSRITAKAFPKLKEILDEECLANPGVDACRNQADLYEMVQQHQKAVEYYKRTRDLMGKDAESAERLQVLEKLALNLFHDKQYVDASQSLKLVLQEQGRIWLKEPERRAWFIGVCLRAAKQVKEEEDNASAAILYQDLIKDLIHITTDIYSIFVLSSEDCDDNPKTERLIKVFRDDLGFNDETCQWLYETGELGKDQFSVISAYVRKCWCCVVHLTDTLLQDNTILRSIGHAIEILTERDIRGHLVVIDDVTDAVDRTDDDWFEKTEKLQSFPWIGYGDVFGNAAPATRCEKVVRALLN